MKEIKKTTPLLGMVRAYIAIYILFMIVALFINQCASR